MQAIFRTNFFAKILQVRVNTRLMCLPGVCTAKLRNEGASSTIAYLAVLLSWSERKLYRL